VLTIWTAIILTAAPVGLTLGGPLVTALGATGTLWTSAASTLALGGVALVTLVLARGAGGGHDRPPGEHGPARGATPQAFEPHDPG
jgi:hypothetical protein